MSLVVNTRPHSSYDMGFGISQQDTGSAFIAKRAALYFDIIPTKEHLGHSTNADFFLAVTFPTSPRRERPTV